MQTERVESLVTITENQKIVEDLIQSYSIDCSAKVDNLNLKKSVDITLEDLTEEEEYYDIYDGAEELGSDYDSSDDEYDDVPPPLVPQSRT